MDLDALREQLIAHEGLRLKPYRCTAGKLTIGVGRNLDDVGISREEALHLLGQDIMRCEADLDRALPWWRQMSERRQRALLDMCFNMGLRTLLSFKNTLALLEAGQYDAAADNALQSKWARQVGKRAITVTNMIREG